MSSFMPNPWDPFPLPTQADDNDRDTYEGVGRVLTMWEHVEFGLSRLYSIFAGVPDTEFVQKYGEKTIFRDRLKILQESAKIFFIKMPSQNLEGTFDEICRITGKYADRRNEVAHAAVFPVSKWPELREHFGISESNADESFVLIPTYYAGKKYNEEGEPTYVYTSVELKSSRLP